MEAGLMPKNSSGWGTVIIALYAHPIDKVASLPRCRPNWNLKTGNGFFLMRGDRPNR